MEIRTLKGIDKADILDVFNTSFSDYFIPFELSFEQLNSKILADKTDFSLSVGVFENDNLIAFMLHGIDTIKNKKIVYNGGTGVIPNKRGTGLTKQMYRYILPILERHGVHRVILEVISKNMQAIKSYKISGFKVKRELLCYKGDIEKPEYNDDLEINTLKHYFWTDMESFWDIHPTWQNSKRTLETLKLKSISLAAYFEKQLVGYIIFNPTNNRIQQLAVHKKFRRNGIASSLLVKIINSYGSKLSIINVDENTNGIHAFLTKLGFVLNLKQLEMELRIIDN